MRTSWRRFAAVTIVAVMAAGCYESGFPLDPEPRVDVDPALLGVWRCLPLDAEPDEAPATLTVTRAAAARTYAAVWQDDSGEPDRYDVFSSVVGSTTYLNVRERTADGRERPWSFMRASLLRPNALHLQIVVESALGGVTATPAALREALTQRQADPALLSDGALCARARPGR